jgi:molybdopterin synthase sulfur carrier subunit
MKALYFAWVRERVGFGEEEIAPPREVESVADLVIWLKSRGDNYAAAFANEKTVRVALDRSHAKPGALIAGAREIAFFPPMTGG